jgi:hypothetical protein
MEFRQLRLRSVRLDVLLSLSAISAGAALWMFVFHSGSAFPRALLVIAFFLLVAGLTLAARNSGILYSLNRIVSGERTAQRRRRATGKLPARSLIRLQALLDAAVRDSTALDLMNNALADAVCFGLDDVRRFEGMTLPRRRLFACFTMEWDLNNGGFLQFLLNEPPSLVGEAKAFLEERGPREVATLLQRAIAVFPEGEVPDKADSIWHSILSSAVGGLPERIGRELGSLDSEFQEHLDSLTLPRLEYARDHGDEFFESGTS